MEGKTYHCIWEKRKDAYYLKLDEDPNILIRSNDFNDATEKLWFDILEKFNDGEAHIEFSPPIPVKEKYKKWFDIEICILEYNDTAEGENFQEGLYEGGYCKNCQRPFGTRTSKERVVTYLPRDHFAGFNGQPHCLIVSDKFLEELKEEERLLIDTVPIKGPPRSRKHYHELIAKSVVPPSLIKGFDFLENGIAKCELCGGFAYHFFNVALPEGVNLFTSKKNIKKVNLNFLTVGIKNKFSICMIIDRWNKFKEKKVAKGITTSLLALLEDNEIADITNVPTLTKYEEYIQNKFGLRAERRLP
jgi:hypothetical protein